MIYLDNGATAFPKPPTVWREMEACLRFYSANAGRGSHRYSVRAAEKIGETRERLARLFHVKNPEQISFMLNCTDGLNTGLFGVLKPGDDVIISDMEHNSVYRPAIHLGERGVRTLFAESDETGMVSPEAIHRVLTPRTRMICIQHASNVGGGINPIREIGHMAREKGIFFMVDAAQTAGSVPIDVEKDAIDILAFPGHKGLLGPQGTGGLYVREGISLEPMRQGGTGSASESSQMPDFLPDRLESGTQNLPGIVGLGAGTEFVLRRGVSNIGHYERALSEYLWKRISNLPGVQLLGPADMEKRTGILALALSTRDPAEVAWILDKRYGIAVRAGLHCAPLAARRFGVEQKGSLRFSPGIFNTMQEMEYTARALGEILTMRA